MICLLFVTLVFAHFEARKLVTASLASLPRRQVLLNGHHMNGEIFDLRKISASAQASLLPDNLYLPHQSTNGSLRANTITAEKSKVHSYSQPLRRKSKDNSETTISNNNSITGEETLEYDRLKVKAIDKDLLKKPKKTTSGNHLVKRKYLDTDSSKPFPLPFPAIDTSSLELLNSECLVNEAVKPQRDKSSSDGNSVFADVTVASLPAKKDKSKTRKKTAKVSPAFLPVEGKTKPLEKVNLKDSDSTKDKEKTDSLERAKDRKSKQISETKEDFKEPKKQDGNAKSVKLPNNKSIGKTSRKTSLPSELEQMHSKTKLDKSKSLPTGLVSKPHLSKPGHSVTSKKNSSYKQTQQNEGTPHTITEAINSALKITLKQSPTAESGHSFSRNDSRCSSTSPSPPLSDSPQNLSQSSRSSSYSSVVGSEESANSESSARKSKHNSRSQKLSSLVIQKPAEHTNPFSVKRLASGNLVNDLSSPAWMGLWDGTKGDLGGSPSLESFPSTSTSSSLFTSTPFDKDGKLERRHKSMKEAPTDEARYHRDKYPLYTFHDVKAPGLSTPFVEVGTSTSKFWPDEPTSSLENLIPIKQNLKTNWVNFLDESTANASKLPSPGMPQSSKTVAEIWDAGQWADENDGWSTAFSPGFEADQTLPSFSGAYDSTWSTGNYQSDYYSMPSEDAWIDTDPLSTSQSEITFSSNDSTIYSNSSGTSHQLNPYSEPWDGSTRANVWSSSKY